MRRALRQLALLIPLLLAACATPRITPPPDASFSGLAPLASGANESSWLVVMDAKDARSARLLVARWAADVRTSVRWEGVGIADWSPVAPRHGTAGHDGVRPPMDLESVCRLPGDALRFLAAESGQAMGGQGRIFELELRRALPGRWRARVRAVHSLPQGAETGASNYEGLACIATGGGSVLLLLAERGGSRQHAQASLRRGVLNSARNRIDWADASGIEGVAPLAEWPAGAEGLRGIADLAIRDDGSLWAVSTQDLGDDGPFRSWIYRLGRIAPNDSATGWLPASRPAVAFRLDGDKAEGLTFTPDGRLVYVTDNEKLGGGIGVTATTP
jgi:hypothetical protein